MKYKIVFIMLTMFAIHSFASLTLTPQEYKYLQNKKQIKMCILPDWLPFEQIDENGIHRGIGADIMKIISEKINTPIVLLPTKKWSQSLENIKTENVIFYQLLWIQKVVDLVWILQVHIQVNHL